MRYFWSGLYLAKRGRPPYFVGWIHQHERTPTILESRNQNPGAELWMLGLALAAFQGV